MKNVKNNSTTNSTKNIIDNNMKKSTGNFSHKQIHPSNIINNSSLSQKVSMNQINNNFLDDE